MKRAEFGGPCGLSKCGEDVHAPVAHERRRAGDRVEDALHARPHLLRRRATTPTGRRARCAREVEEVCALGLVELERARKRLENAFGDSVRVAALETRVVVDADAGEERHFLPTEARNTPIITVRAQARLPRRDLRSPGGQELSDLAPGVHRTR